MTAYEPGTVAVVFYLGDHCRAMRTGISSWGGWEVVLNNGRKMWVSDKSDMIADIRPLVVLDLSAAGYHAEGFNFILREAARELASPTQAELLGFIADQIEAQTKPPRIPEPTLYGVVEASAQGDGSHRQEFIRTKFGWSNGHFVHSWNGLKDPVLVREGVQS